MLPNLEFYKDRDGFVRAKTEDEPYVNISKPTCDEIAQQWIDEMQELGLTPDEMIKVIELARKKYDALKTDKNGK